MIPVRAVQGGTDLSFDILITRHPNQCVRNCAVLLLTSKTFSLSVDMSLFPVTLPAKN